MPLSLVGFRGRSSADGPKTAQSIWQSGFHTDGLPQAGVQSNATSEPDRQQRRKSSSRPGCECRVSWTHCSCRQDTKRTPQQEDGVPESSQTLPGSPRAYERMVLVRAAKPVRGLSLTCLACRHCLSLVPLGAGVDPEPDDLPGTPPAFPPPSEAFSQDSQLSQLKGLSQWRLLHWLPRRQGCSR